jgi:hypothetical protein
MQTIICKVDIEMVGENGKVEKKKDYKPFEKDHIDSWVIKMNKVIKMLMKENEFVCYKWRSEKVWKKTCYEIQKI